jgi:hypothetical protein
MHKWERDIYIGFSPALHLQCMQWSQVRITLMRSKIRIRIRINEEFNLDPHLIDNRDPNPH